MPHRLCGRATTVSSVKRLAPRQENKKLSYRSEDRSSASCFRLIIKIIMPLTGSWIFLEFSYTLRVGFLRHLHGNGWMRVCKNSIDSTLWRLVTACVQCVSTTHPRTRWVMWERRRSFDGQLYQQHSYQQLLNLIIILQVTIDNIGHFTESVQFEVSFLKIIRIYRH